MDSVRTPAAFAPPPSSCGIYTQCNGAVAGVTTSGCGYLATMKAQMAFKDANAAYQTQDYKKAIEKYKEALGHKPDLAVAYFYLGNSYDNLYKPARKGEPANDANLQEAVNYYRKESLSKVADPALIAKIASENDIVLTAIGD